jgi:hypothetical protein
MSLELEIPPNLQVHEQKDRTADLPKPAQLSASKGITPPNLLDHSPPLIAFLHLNLWNPKP